MSITAVPAGNSNVLRESGYRRFEAIGMRPGTAHVHVTELANTTINPTPKRSESRSEIFEEYICGAKDLGASLGALEILWMPRSCLKCLDGLSSMGNLVELYLAFNEIKDISSCAMLERLEILDLEGFVMKNMIKTFPRNQISDKCNLSFLKMCANLTHLTLEGNPLVSSLGGVKSYRREVCKALPQVRMLDDIPVEKEVISKYSDYSVGKFEDEWTYINSLLKEVGLLSSTSESLNACELQGVERTGHSLISVHDASRKKPISPGNGKELPKERRTKRLVRELSRTTDEAKSNEKKPVDIKTTDLILQEEEQLRIECDAVLKELADWRKCYSESGAFSRRKSVPQILKVHSSEKDAEAILLSTDSESTLEDHSAVIKRSRENQSNPRKGVTSIVGDEDCMSEMSSSSGYESRRTTTAGTDYNESPRDEKPDSKSFNTIQDSSGHFITRSDLKLVDSVDRNVPEEMAQTLKETTSKPKTKNVADGLLPGQLANLQAIKSTTKRSGRSSFPPLSSNGISSSGTTGLRTTTEVNYRPRLNVSNGKPETAVKNDGRQAGRSNPVTMESAKSGFAKSISKGLSNRLDTAGRLTSKWLRTNSSPLPSKPNVQPKM
ncbi:unnamed protein product [Echinostoma caproni]|uniref:Leucine-rich repeat-containing protein 56 n=1 Tax=Echinostoma caproni TaxID=27848 RepID=A0A183AFH4_9TREM|nr:unnamed protein product [Echinostoma caproni]